MGWNLVLAVIKFGKAPVTPSDIHCLDEAKRVVLSLGLGPITGATFSNLDRECRIPKGRTVVVGAYPTGVVLICPELIGAVENGGLMVAVVKEFPDARILFCELTSATSFVAFSAWDAGRELRRFVGDAQRGDTVNVGNLLPAEKAVLSCKNQTDLRLWSIGQELLFSMIAEFLPERFDKLRLEEFPVVTFRVGRPIWPFSLLKRKVRS